MLVSYLEKRKCRLRESMGTEPSPTGDTLVLAYRLTLHSALCSFRSQQLEDICLTNVKFACSVRKNDHVCLWECTTVLCCWLCKTLQSKSVSTRQKAYFATVTPYFWYFHNRNQIQKFYYRFRTQKYDRDWICKLKRDSKHDFLFGKFTIMLLYYDLDRQFLVQNYINFDFDYNFFICTSGAIAKHLWSISHIIRSNTILQQ